MRGIHTHNSRTAFGSVHYHHCNSINPPPHTQAHVYTAGDRFNNDGGSDDDDDEDG